MWKKILGYILLTLIAVAGIGFGYLYFRKPASAPAADIKVDMSPARIARGEYIFTLADCNGCHSQHDYRKQDSPVLVSAGLGSGQVMGNIEGLDISIPNITPDPHAGIGGWTDGEKIRAIREGIGHDGGVLFPMMPYTQYRYMSDEDVQSLVAYLNTLKPVSTPVPRMKVPLMISL